MKSDTWARENERVTKESLLRRQHASESFGFGDYVVVADGYHPDIYVVVTYRPKDEFAAVMNLFTHDLFWVRKADISRSKKTRVF